MPPPNRPAGPSGNRPAGPSVHKPPAPAAPTGPAVPTGPASVIAKLGGHSGGVLAVAFSPDRGVLASSGRDGVARLWDLTNVPPGEKGPLGATGRRIQSLSFSPNGKQVLCGSGALDGVIYLFDLAGSKPREACMLRGARGAINALAFSPDGTLVAGAGEDRVFRVWEPGPGSRAEPRAQLPAHAGPIRALAFAPDGQGVATASDDSTVKLWTVSRIRSSERVVIPHPVGVTAVAFSPDGHILLTGGRDGTIRLWDPNASKPFPRGELTGTTSAIKLLVVTADGRTLVSVTDGPKVVHWDLGAGRPVREWMLPAASQCPVAVTKDGRYLAMGKDAGGVEVYRVAEKRSSGP